MLLPAVLGRAESSRIAYIYVTYECIHCTNADMIVLHVFVIFHPVPSSMIPHRYETVREMFGGHNYIKFSAAALREGSSKGYSASNHQLRFKDMTNRGMYTGGRRWGGTWFPMRAPHSCQISLPCYRTRCNAPSERDDATPRL